MNAEYEKFVNSLMKPADILDQEITVLEEEMIDFVFELVSQCESIHFLRKDILNCFNFVERKYLLALKHMEMGFLGESAELIDPIKRIVIYRKNISLVKDGQSLYDNLKEEIGDLIFYLVGHKLVLFDVLNKYTQSFHKVDIDCLNEIIDAISNSMTCIENLINKINNYIKLNSNLPLISLQEIQNNNEEKLRKRYGSGNYSDKQANERKDKQEQ